MMYINCSFVCLSMCWARLRFLANLHSLCNSCTWIAAATKSLEKMLELKHIYGLCQQYHRFCCFELDPLKGTYIGLESFLSTHSFCISPIYNRLLTNLLPTRKMQLLWCEDLFVAIQCFCSFRKLMRCGWF